MVITQAVAFHGARAHQLSAAFGAISARCSRRKTQLAFVVRSMRTVWAARMDDVLEVITTPHEVRSASITLDQRVMRGEDVLIQARGSGVCVGRSGATHSRALRTAMRADQKPAL